MLDRLLASLRCLSDSELVAQLQDLAARERETTAMLVAHLAELESRGLHTGLPTLTIA